MSFSMSMPELLIVLAIVALIFGTRGPKGIGDGSLRSQLVKELGRMPVYSAETTNAQEAEFIRDRLPSRFPTAVVLVIVVVIGATLWWLARSGP